MIHFTIHVPSQISREFSFSDLFCWGMLGTSNYAKKPLCCVKKCELKLESNDTRQLSGISMKARSESAVLCLGARVHGLSLYFQKNLPHQKDGSHQTFGSVPAHQWSHLAKTARKNPLRGTNLVVDLLWTNGRCMRLHRSRCDVPSARRGICNENCCCATCKGTKNKPVLRIIHNMNYIIIILHITAYQTLHKCEMMWNP